MSMMVVVEDLMEEHICRYTAEPEVWAYTGLGKTERKRCECKESTTFVG